jgi:gliding motility-associated-like protein
MKHKIFTILSLLFSSIYFAQTYSLTTANSGTTISTCTGTFFDNGGSGAVYSNNQNTTITFCPGTPGQTIKVAFSVLELRSTTTILCDDELEVYQGDAAYAAPLIAAGTPDAQLCGTYTGINLPVFYSTAPNGCITFHFKSNASLAAAGWVAAISCVTQCKNPTAALLNSSIVSICSPNSTNPGSTLVNFDASTSTLGAYSSGTYLLTTYNWTFGDGTTATTSVPTISHTYPNTSGKYVASLFVGDNNTDGSPSGCQSSNEAKRIIQVLPAPTFTSTTVSPQSIGCGSNATLTGVATSQTETQNIPSVSGVKVSLPDGSGSSYVSSANFSGLFPTAATISSGCYPTIWLNLEHSWSSDLTIDLISPSGQVVRFFNRHGAGTTTNPVRGKFGKCVNGIDGDGIAGCGATYSVVNTGGQSWTNYTSAAVITTTTSSCTDYNGTCETGNYYRSNVYNSSSPFSSLDGSTMSGVWQLKITDNVPRDDGFLFGWGLVFPASCYADLETNTPNLPTASAVWTSGGSGPAVPLSQTASSLSVSSPGPDACPSGATCVGTKLINTINFGPFDTPGTYPYIYNVSDEYGCAYTKTVDVAVSCACPTISLVSYAGGSFCKSLTSEVLPSITGSGSIAGGTFSFTPVGLSLDAATGAFIPSLSAANEYTVTYLVVPSLTNCPSASISTVITIYSNPTVAVSSNTSVCSGSTVVVSASNASSYTWSNGDINSSILVNPTADAVYTVTGTTNGCTDTETISVTVIPNPTVTIINSNAQILTCANTTAVISTTTNPPTGISYVWLGTGINTFTTNTVPVTSSGDYTVVITNMVNGCTNSDVTTVAQNIAAPTLTASSITIACTNTYVIGASSASDPNTTYSWLAQSGSILSGSATATPTIVGDINGIYTVTVTSNDNGCKETGTVNVSVTPVVAAFSANPMSGAAPLAVDFSNQSTGATAYAWTFGDSNNNTSILGNPSHTYSTTGSYVATLIAYNGAFCPSTATLSIEVYENTTLIIPNVFTPNGDGKNDVFKITSTGLKDLNCTIFNRWGNKLYTIETVTGTWDGSGFADGTYFYVLIANGMDGKEYKQQGTVDLFR